MNFGATLNSYIINESMRLNLVSKRQWNSIAERLDLTERELEVVKLLFEQKTRDEIAKKLELKPRTIRHHMENIHVKLGVNNRVGVVLRIIQVRDSLA
jgi:DNA-binding CsgD family transcriptional regulator